MSLTLLMLIASSLLVLIGLFRVDTRQVHRGLMFWWVWTAFGLQLVYTALVAAGIVADPNSTLGFLLNVPMLGIGLVMAVRAALRGGNLSGGALLCAAPVLLSASYVLGGSSVGIPIQAIVSMALAIVIPKTGYDSAEVSAGLVFSIRCVPLVLLGLAAIGNPTLIGECRADKCSLWGQQIGQAGNANGLGMSIAFVAIVAVANLRWWRVVVVLIGAALLSDLSSSRSALLPLAFGLLAILVERLTRGLARTVLRAITVTSVTVIIVVVGLWPWPPQTFTDRAGLWAHALNLTAQRPWFGWGLSYWVRQPHTTTLDANYSAHNMLLEVLVDFGVVGLLMTVIGLFLVWWTLRPGSRSLWFVALVCLLGGGIAEVVAAPGRFFLVPGAFILLLVLDLGSRADRHNQLTAQVGDPAADPGLTEIRLQPGEERLLRARPTRSRAG